MTWVRLDDGFDENEKVMRVSDAAFRVYIYSLTSSARRRTDGLVSEGFARTRGWVKRAVELVEAGLWEVVEDGWLVHDYLEYNPSKAEVEREREERLAIRSAGGRARAAQAQRSGGRFKPASTPAEPPADHQQSAGGYLPADHQQRTSPDPVPDPVPDPKPDQREIHTAREEPRLLAPSLTPDQQQTLDALHEQVHRLVFGGSDAPPMGWCEDLIRRGATLTDVDHAVQASIGKSLEYVRACLERRVKEREQGGDPDAAKARVTPIGGRRAPNAMPQDRAHVALAAGVVVVGTMPDGRPIRRRDIERGHLEDGTPVEATP